MNELLQVTPENPETLIGLAKYLKSKGKEGNKRLEQVLPRLERLRLNDDQKLELGALAAEAGWLSLAKEKALQVHGDPEIEGRKFQLLADIASQEKDWMAYSKYSATAIQKYRTTGQQERAVRYALQVVFKLSKVEQRSQTRERLQKLIQDFPDEADPYYQLAKWIEKESPQLSLQYLEKATELDPKNFFYADLLASRYIALSRYPEAEKIYHSFLEDKKFQNKAYLRMVQAKILQGKSSDAESLMEEAANKGRQSERFLIEMARLHEKTGDYRRAAETYQQLAALRPGRTNSYLISAGKAYTKAGDREAARTQYLQVLEIDPENIRARQALAELE